MLKLRRPESTSMSMGFQGMLESVFRKMVVEGNRLGLI